MARERDKVRAIVRNMIDKMTTEELSFVLGRYCGPGNQILCEKKYGFIIPADLIQQALADRIFEETFFDPETK